MDKVKCAGFVANEKYESRNMCKVCGVYKGFHGKGKAVLTLAKPMAQGRKNMIRDWGLAECWEEARMNRTLVREKWFDKACDLVKDRDGVLIWVAFK